MIPSHLWLWSRFAWPASARRQEFVLPLEWKWNMVSDDVDDRSKFGQMSLAAILNTPLMTDIYDCLLTDPKPWYIGLRNLKDDEAWEANYFAEKLVMYLYNIDESTSQKSYDLNMDLLHYGLANAATKKAEFLKYYSTQAIDTKTNELSLWSAIDAYNSHRFDMFTIEEVWKSAKEICIDESIQLEFEQEYEPMQGDVCALRSVWIQSVLVREHAIAKAVYEFTEAAKEWNFDKITWKHLRLYKAPETRFNPHSATPLTHLLYILRIIITFSIGLRNSLQDHDIFKYYPVLEKVWLWCVTKQPTLLALCSDKHMNLELLNAIGKFESAVLTEQWAFVNFIRAKKRFTNKDVDLNFVKEIRRDLILGHICLTQSDNKYLWKDVSVENKLQCEQIYDSVPDAALRPSHLIKLIAIAVVKAEHTITTDDSISAICALVSQKDLLLQLGNTLVKAEPQIQLRKEWDLPIDMTLQELLRIHQNEDRKRIQFALGEQNEIGERTQDPFEGSPFSIQTLKQLTEKGKTYGLS